MEKKQTTGINVGGSSLLIIFVLLCLTTFATLSLVSANADLRLTEKTARAATEYYIADTLGEETLAQLIPLLQQAYTPGDSAAYFSRLESSLSELSFPARLVTNEQKTFIEYTVPINEKLQLVVSLELLFPPGAEAPLFRRSKWQAEAIREAPELDEEALNLWNGGFDGAPGLVFAD
ncbi:hypothetical protein U6B65_08865 [Oscillospiraceae bacterium MB08-C2-2]|nr:hypothetical protein U6B65_08865 [Oscillospiraceae bacterium MB08-C2-2]